MLFFQDEIELLAAKRRLFLAKVENEKVDISISYWFFYYCTLYIIHVHVYGARYDWMSSAIMYVYCILLYMYCKIFFLMELFVTIVLSHSSDKREIISKEWNHHVLYYSHIGEDTGILLHVHVHV